MAAGRKKPMRMTRRALALWVLCFSVAHAAQAQDTARDRLRITYLDVGQGDATLILTPEGRRILIDAGSAGSQVAQFLVQQGIDTLDLVIASHNHADHIGGVPDVFAATVVRMYMDNGLPHTTATYRRVLFAAEIEPGLQYLEPTERTIRSGSVALRILPPPGLEASQNNNSVGVLVEYGSFRALFTGDSEHRQIAHWLSEGKVARVTLLKAAHHGAWNGATLDWIKATSPQVVVISVGGRNSYGHPSPAIVQAWLAASARVYRTDVDGSVLITAGSDGKFTVQTSSPGPRPPR